MVPLRIVQQSEKRDSLLFDEGKPPPPPQISRRFPLVDGPLPYDSLLYIGFIQTFIIFGSFIGYLFGIYKTFI